MATQSYLPAALRLVVQPAGKMAYWYVTQKEIILGSGNETATCPVTGFTVRTIVQDGVRVFFLPNQVNYRQVDEPGDNNLNACLLLYDIPQNAPIDNPSPVLRRLGLRVNLSCWVIPESDLPYTLLHEMQVAGATWHAVRFDRSEAAKLVQMGVQSLKRELADQVARARRSQARAMAVLDETTESAERAEQRYLRESAVIVRRYEELAADLQTAAARFGIAPETFGLADATAAMAGIGLGMAERAKLFVQSRAAIAAASLTGTAPDENTPVGIVADMAEDMGLNETAAGLRAGFAGVPGSMLPANAGNADFFRLTDGDDSDAA